MYLFVIGASGLSATPVAVLIALGVVVAIAGYLVGSRPAVIAGLAILFVGTALMVVGAYMAFEDDPGDPRPCAPRSSCR